MCKDAERVARYERRGYSRNLGYDLRQREDRWLIHLTARFAHVDTARHDVERLNLSKDKRG